MFYRFGFFALLLGLLSACVSPKVVEELKQAHQETQWHNKSLKKENLDANTQNTELTAKVDRLSTEISQLTNDSTKRSIALTQLQNNYQELNDAYDLLLTEQTQTMAKKAIETTLNFWLNPIEILWPRFQLL